MPDPTELLLIRHGESEGNVGTSRQPDCALTERGVGQAGAVAPRLASLDLRGFIALTSPYRRARQTADVIAAAMGLRFEVEPMVREWGPAATVGGEQFPAESPDELVVRLIEFLRRRQGQRLLIVSHAAPIAVLTQLAWGEPVNTQGQFWLGVGNCCPRWLKATCGPAV